MMPRPEDVEQAERVIRELSLECLDRLDAGVPVDMDRKYAVAQLAARLISAARAMVSEIYMDDEAFHDWIMDHIHEHLRRAPGGKAAA